MSHTLCPNYTPFGVLSLNVAFYLMSSPSNQTDALHQTLNPVNNLQCGWVRGEVIADCRLQPRLRKLQELLP